MNITSEIWIVVDCDDEAVDWLDVHLDPETAALWASELDDENPTYAPHRVLHLTVKEATPCAS